MKKPLFHLYFIDLICFLSFYCGGFSEADMTMIELKREDSSEGLGITVTGYRTADGRYVAMHCQ